MTTKIEAQPQVLSSPSEEVQPEGMEQKKMVITVLASIRFAYLCFLIIVIFIFSDENSELFIHLIYTSICAIFEMVGLVGVVRNKVCAIRCYIAYGIISYVVYMLTVCFSKDGQVKPLVILGQSVYTFLYFLIVYYYLQDCNTVRKSKRQQEHQANVVYRAEEGEK